MNWKKLRNNEKLKNAAIITAAVVLPFGLTVLGLWKAYDLMKSKKKEENGKEI